jgi:hypothetical protein
MANISITAASVLASASASKRTYTAGATITAGQPVYFDSAAGTVKLAGATTAPLAAVVGIAINGASAGQPITVAATDADFTAGGTLVAGQIYVLSATAGSIAPVADLTTGNFRTVLGVAKSTTKLVLATVAGGVAGPA